MIEGTGWEALRRTVTGDMAPEVADLLRQLDKPGRVLLFRALGRDAAAEVFAHPSPPAQDGLLRELADDETRELLATLRPDDRTQSTT